MAEKMALIPPNLLRHYQLSKSESHLEGDIDELLNKNELPDDMKVKLLGQLIQKYHRITHTPIKPLPVSFPKEDVEKVLMDEKENVDPIYEQIYLSVPIANRPFISEIKKAFARANYGWNDLGEFTINGEPIAGSHVADLFSYVMRNRKKDIAPKGFYQFWKALKEARIPKEFTKRDFTSPKLPEAPKRKVPRRTDKPLFFQKGKRADTGSESASDDSEKQWLNL